MERSVIGISEYIDSVNCWERVHVASESENRAALPHEVLCGVGKKELKLVLVRKN